MFSIWLGLSIVHLAEAFGSLLKGFRFRKFFFRARNHTPARWPKVAVLAPCKWLESNLRENVRSWFSLDYPDYHVFLIVESEADPAVSILKDFREGELVVAGRAVDCGQKIHNLRYAIERIPDDFEVFAFIDSDCSVRNDWLMQLVSRLDESPEDAATGYRWFLCDKDGPGCLLRAVWNSSILTLYDEEATKNFAWGGSTAIFRQTFFAAKTLDFWKGSISDDYGLTNALHANGGKVHFVPGALAFTSDSISIRDFFAWAARQLLITRVYNPALWTLAFLFHALWVVWLVLGFFYPAWFIVIFLMVQIAQSLKAELRLQCAQRALGGEKASSRFWFFVLGPFIALSNFAMMLWNLMSRSVRWRGVEYRLQGPNDVVIRHL